MDGGAGGRTLAPWWRGACAPSARAGGGGERAGSKAQVMVLGVQVPASALAG